MAAMPSTTANQPSLALADEDVAPARAVNSIRDTALAVGPTKATAAKNPSLALGDEDVAPATTANPSRDATPAVGPTQAAAAKNPSLALADNENAPAWNGTTATSARRRDDGKPEPRYWMSFNPGSINSANFTVARVRLAEEWARQLPSP